MQESVGMKTLELVFFDAGGGHRSAANALCEVARRQKRPWEMKMLNLQELLDEMDVFRKITGVRLQDLYNLMLRRGWTLGSPTLMTGMHGIIRLLHAKQVKLLAGHGDLGHSELQSRYLRRDAALSARSAAGHHPYRYGRLPTAFLD
jgi:hypothetical protein